METNVGEKSLSRNTIAKKKSTGNYDFEKLEALKDKATRTIKDYLSAISCESYGRIVEILFRLLADDDNYSMDEDLVYSLRETCKEMLVLLSNASIGSQLPEYLQSKVGRNLSKMFDFFDSIGDDSCIAAFDLEGLNYSYTNDKEVYEKDLKHLEATIHCYQTRLNQKKI